MGKFNISLKQIIVVLILFLSLLIVNEWFHIIQSIQLENDILIIIFAIIGLSLLPFSDKIKFGNFLEISRIRENLDQVKKNQYIGEVVKLKSSEEKFFIDEDSKHKIADEETARFLSSRKGILNISEEDLKNFPTAYEIESVVGAKKISWQGHIFVVLNDKKFHVGSASLLADWGVKENNIEKIDDEKIKEYPTGN